MTASPHTPVDPDVLERQAIVAAEHGNPRLAASLRRAAELARMPSADVERLVAALRPHRSTAEELTALAAWLDAHDYPLNAAHVRTTRDARIRDDLTGPPRRGCRSAAPPGETG